MATDRDSAVPQFVDVGDARIRYCLDGPAGAPLVVLSSSLGADVSMWEPQLQTLTRNFRALRYDSRGHGRTSVTPGPYTIERLGHDVLGLLDGLAIERPHFCGLSMGGMTGMWLAIHAPDRIGKMALANTAARIGPPELWNARIETVRTGGLGAISQAVIERWFTPAFRARVPEIVDATRRMLERAPAEGYVACCAAVRDTDLRDALAAVRTPTLVIAGAHDVATPPTEGRSLAERIPGARYVELDAAHLSNIEAEARFNEALLSFLAT